MSTLSETPALKVHYISVHLQTVAHLLLHKLSAPLYLIHHWSVTTGPLYSRYYLGGGPFSAQQRHWPQSQTVHQLYNRGVSDKVAGEFMYYTSYQTLRKHILYYTW